MQDLRAQTIADEVVGLTFSEFGRKAKENGSYGTDHGEIAPMFVFGNPVEGGISGNNPNLSEAVEDNNYQIKTVQFDYRQTFGTLLQDFLGASNLVIDNAFFNNTANQSFTDQKIENLLKDSFSVAMECYSDVLSTDALNNPENNEWFVYPNPFTHEININALEEFNNLQYQLFDSRGKLVQQNTLGLQNNYFKIIVPVLASGIYFLKLGNGNKTEVHKLFRL